MSNSIYYGARICADTVVFLHSTHPDRVYIFELTVFIFMYVIIVFLDALTVFIYSQIFASREQSICLSYRLKFIGLIFQLSIDFLGYTNGYTLLYSKLYSAYGYGPAKLVDET
jgi:hypothetical protein